MREVKFRGKTESGEWVYGWLYRHSGKTFIMCNDDEHIIDPNSVGQYTGQKCNGQEVYDKDIFEFDKDEWGSDNNIHVVSWDNENACWSFGGGTVSDMGFRKVIGNTTDNPELIK